VAALVWQIRGAVLDLSRPRIMGILNVTPDSFSDGGLYADPAAACRRAEALVREGADLVDVGGASSRPGADPVPEAVERDRVLPVLGEAVRLGVPVSIDTCRAGVARAALDAGAAVVNDISALGDPGMGPLVAASEAGLVLMHMRGTPGTMQDDPRYEDVVGEVASFLKDRAGLAEGWGVGRERIVLDPGIGFGKTLTHNLTLIGAMDVLAGLGYPMLLGASRKSFLEKLTRAGSPERRVAGSVAAVLAARRRGTALFRVHDVAATREALAVFDAVEGLR